MELLKKISKTGLSGNQFLLCLVVESKLELSKEITSQLISQLTLKDYQVCIKKGYIIQKKPNIFVPENLEITEKFLIFVRDKEGKLPRGTLNEWFDEWYAIFPEGVKSGGYGVRSQPKPCKKNLTRFLKEYPEYDADIIIAATKLYVGEFALRGYAYMKIAPYFVFKGREGMSVLSEYCEKIVKGDKEERIGVGERQI